MSGVEFTAVGTVGAQGSKVGRVVAGRVVMREQSAKVKPWRLTVKHAALDALGDAGPLLGPVTLEAHFLMARPKAHYRTGRFAHELRADAPTWCTARVGDIDKAVRAVADALTEAQVWRDDSQVVRLLASMRYADPPQRPGARVSVRPLPDRGGAT